MITNERGGLLYIRWFRKSILVICFLDVQHLEVMVGYAAVGGLQPIGIQTLADACVIHGLGHAVANGIHIGIIYGFQVQLAGLLARSMGYMGSISTI